MNYYECEGHRKIQAENMRDAAEIFASIKANRLGKNGQVVTLQADSWTHDNSCVQYQAFIGTYSHKERATTGENEWFEVRLC